MHNCCYIYYESTPYSSFNFQSCFAVVVVVDCRYSFVFIRRKFESLILLNIHTKCVQKKHTHTPKRRRRKRNSIPFLELWLDFFPSSSHFTIRFVSEKRNEIWWCVWVRGSEQKEKERERVSRSVKKRGKKINITDEMARTNMWTNGFLFNSLNKFKRNDFAWAEYLFEHHFNRSVAHYLIWICVAQHEKAMRKKNTKNHIPLNSFFMCNFQFSKKNTCVHFIEKEKEGKWIIYTLVPRASACVNAKMFGGGATKRMPI